MQNTSFLCRKSPLGMLSNRCTAQSVSTLRMPVGELLVSFAFPGSYVAVTGVLRFSEEWLCSLTQWFAAADKEGASALL